MSETNPPGAPTVVTKATTDVSPTSARLHARVYPNGAATTVYFDLEASKRFAPTDSIEVEASRDTLDVHVDVTGLMPSTAYAYRAQAFNDFGSSEGDEETFATIAPNDPPQTQITATPPNLNDVFHRVAFFWNGNDPDGTVQGFEWRISDNGADGVVDVPDTLGLPWGRTTVTDSTFVVSADLPAFAGNPDRFWQTHTFFIRAVDDRDARDPTPSFVSFTATTWPPKMQIDNPSGSASCTDVTGSTQVAWTGEDLDTPNLLPADVRWILLEAQPDDDGDCWSQDEYEAQQPLDAVADDDPRWSSWQPYDQTLEIRLPARPAGTAALLCVVARDAAGAVTPDREWNVNVLAVRFATTARVEGEH